jgi:hypothetical protein
MEASTVGGVTPQKAGIEPEKEPEKLGMNCWKYVRTRRVQHTPGLSIM